MPDCIICYDGGAATFKPQVGHIACLCKYDIHDKCYREWLNASENLVFHCVICRKTMTKVEAMEQEIRNYNDWERAVCYSLATFFIVINFYKELIALLLFVTTVLYVKKIIEIRAQGARY